MKSQILNALRKQGHEVLYVKGIYCVRGVGRLSTRQALKLANIKHTPKPQQGRIGPYGDYAIIAAINCVK